MNERERYGRYELLRRIAIGGMAEIFLANETGLAGFERLVIIKRVLPGLSDDIDFIDMFLDEARLAARLTHPNIVHIYELGEEDGTYFIAMEYVAGGDLHELFGRLHNEILPLPDSLHIITEVCAGLQFAHALAGPDGQLLGVVHRDVTPKNVLLSVDGVVKVVDFGIAKARARLSVTRPGDIKGTFSYMSPEQARGEQVDRRADVYSVGSLTYRLVTGTPAYPQVGDDLLSAVRASQFVRPRRINPEVPTVLEDIILRAMSLDPKDRFPTCGAMRRELVEASRALSYHGDSDSIAALVRRGFPQVPGVTVPAEQAPEVGARPKRTNPLEEALRLAGPDESTGLVSLPEMLNGYAPQDAATEVSPFAADPNDATELVLMPGDVLSSVPVDDFDDPTNILPRHEIMGGAPSGSDLEEPPTERSGSPLELGLPPVQVSGSTVTDDEPTHAIRMPPSSMSPPGVASVGPTPQQVTERGTVEAKPTTPSATPIVRSPKSPKNKKPKRWVLLLIAGFAIGLVLIFTSVFLFLTPPSSSTVHAATDTNGSGSEATPSFDPSLLAGDPSLSSNLNATADGGAAVDPDPLVVPATDGGGEVSSDAAVAVDVGLADLDAGSLLEAGAGAEESLDASAEAETGASPAPEVEPDPEPTPPVAEKALAVGPPPPHPNKTIKRRPRPRPVKQHKRRPSPTPSPTPAPTPQPAAKGFLTVFVTPSAKVYLNGRLIGSSPIAKREVPVGSHTVRIVAHGDTSKTKSLRVKVTPGGHARVRQNL